MSELYYRALRTLPMRFVHDKTEIQNYGNTDIIAANPDHAPIVYRRKTGRWVLLKPYYGADGKHNDETQGRIFKRIG